MRFERHCVLHVPLLLVLSVIPVSAQGTWTKRSISVQPGATWGNGLVYMDHAKKMLLQGDYKGRPVSWEWNGQTWSKLAPLTTPSLNAVFAMAYDSKRRRVVMFGGNGSRGVMNETWEWDGKTWIKMNPKTSPPARREFAGAFDSKRGKFVIFGGYTGRTELNDTWEWDGVNWIQAKPKTVPPRLAAQSMIYDSRRGRTVMFGGGLSYASYSDTWEWDGVNWTKRSPVTRPRGRAYFSMAYDAVRGRTVVFGGLDRRGNVRLNDTWEWDGTAWTRVFTAISPKAGYGHAMAFDPRRNRMLMYGGTAGKETWEYRVAPLWANTPSISVSSGGSATFGFSAGSRHGRKVFLILGSMSGTSPGIKLGSLTLPLNPDSYFTYTASDPGGLIQGSLGILDLQGRGNAKLVLPPRLGTPFLGRTMHHSCLVLWLGPRFDFVSNAVPLKLVK